MDRFERVNEMLIEHWQLKIEMLEISANMYLQEAVYASISMQDVLMEKAAAYEQQAAELRNNLAQYCNSGLDWKTFWS